MRPAARLSGHACTGPHPDPRTLRSLVCDKAPRILRLDGSRRPTSGESAHPARARHGDGPLPRGLVVHRSDRPCVRGAGRCCAESSTCA